MDSCRPGPGRTIHPAAHGRMATDLACSSKEEVLGEMEDHYEAYF
jgi:hypothetical protein